LLVLLAIPSIIHISAKNHLFDSNTLERKNHRYGISRLGGVAVFCSLVLTTLLLSDFKDNNVSNYLLTAFILIFAVGLKDDLWGVNASTKFFIQLLASLTVVLLADIRITNMHGIFNIEELPFWASVGFSTLLIIFITNSFNLIDGIDGLVGATALLTSVAFGFLFAYMGQYSFACMAFTITGATIGFLKFNFSPARIFMGDAGSMLIGLVFAVLAISFIELNNENSISPVHFASAPAFAIAFLIGPIFDVVRVFCLRLVKKGSPFKADSNHTHHRMLRFGFNHKHTTFILISFNNIMVSLIIYLRDWGNVVLIALLFTCCVLFNLALTLAINYKEGKLYKSVPVTRLAQS
jgi:UDP-N-acetylmuramyl pentapeptide phosphotransferase/UDP-N-acetylglucosamine-1-phosphate transferase